MSTTIRTGAGLPAVSPHLDEGELYFDEMSGKLHVKKSDGTVADAMPATDLSAYATQTWVGNTRVGLPSQILNIGQFTGTVLPDGNPAIIAKLSGSGSNFNDKYLPASGLEWVLFESMSKAYRLFVDGATDEGPHIYGPLGSRVYHPTNGGSMGFAPQQDLVGVLLQKIGVDWYVTSMPVDLNLHGHRRSVVRNAGGIQWIDFAAYNELIVCEGNCEIRFSMPNLEGIVAGTVEIITLTAGSTFQTYGTLTNGVLHDAGNQLALPAGRHLLWIKDTDPKEIALHSV